jgi:hypothetical protein
MSHSLVRIRELKGWGFDNYEYRPELLERTTLSHAADIVARCPPFKQSNIVLAPETEQLHEAFYSYKKRPDLLSEMSGLSWSLGVVDLRSLVAFQRRLAFPAQTVQPSMPIAGDWPALLALSFGSPKPIGCEITHDRSNQTVVLRSNNPDLHFRITNDPASPLSVHGGGPFFEVACFRDRWFLRDGYHRAYSLLKDQVFEVPAVIVQAATIEELGANQSWFFPEEVLFSSAPPRVIDFLNDDLVFEYERAALIKTLRITIEETLKPATLTGEQP